MTYRGQSYVPLRKMRDNRNEKSPETSYWPLKCEGDVEKEGNKGGNDSESTEVWSAIQNVKDYVWSSGSQLIGTIKGLCKTPKSLEEESSSTPLKQSNDPTQSQMCSLLKNEIGGDVTTAGWPKSLRETDETASWIKNMLSDPDVSGETKFIIWRMVELEYMGQSGTMSPKVFGNQQQRLLPSTPSRYSRSITPTPRHSLYGSRQTSPRRSLYEGARSVSGLPPLGPPRRLSGRVTDLRAMTPYSQMSPYRSQAWSSSRASSRRGSANFSGLGSPFSVPDKEVQLRYRPVREFGLSPKENQRGGLVSYSDPTIARALDNYRRGRMAYTKDDFDKYNRVKRSQFVGYRSRLELSATKKREQQKRKSYRNRWEPSRTSSAKRSRSGIKKENKRAGITFDTESVNDRFEPDTCSTATTLTQSPIANDDSMRSTTSKDNVLKNAESQMSTDAASLNSLFAVPKSVVAANLFGTSPKKAVTSGGTDLNGGVFATSSNINLFSKEKPISTTKLETARAKALASISPEPKPSTTSLFGSTKPGLFDTSNNSKPSTFLPIPQTSSTKGKKIPEKTAIEKSAAEKDAEVKNKYHKTRQDHMFYTKLCKKYKVEPSDEYDGHDPDIKPDEEMEDDKQPQATKPPVDKPAPLLFGIPAATNVKSLENITPFANNPFAVKKPAKLGGFNFSGNNGNLLNRTSSPGQGLFSQESAKSSNGQLKAGNLFSGKVISSTPSISLFGNPLNKAQKPSGFTFGATKPTNGESKATTLAKKESEAKKVRLSGKEVFKGCDKNALWAHHFEGTMPTSEDKAQAKKDDETADKKIPLFGASSSSETTETSLFGDKGPSGNIFGGDSNNALTIPKPSSTASFNLFSNTIKPAGGGLFGMSAAKTNGGSTNNNSGGLFSGTSITGKNMFELKSGSSSNLFANGSIGGSPAAKNIFAANTNSKGPGSLLSTPSQASSNGLFSSTGNGMFSANSNRFNINNNTEKSDSKFQFGKVNGKSKTNGKRRRIVRGRRTMK